MTDPRFAQIESHRPYLVRYALSQLRDAELAEEAVQEALLSALESLSNFEGKSSLRTWLTSILRFKVIDLQRRAVLDETGHWSVAPGAWSNPEAAFEQRRFWEVFESCLDKLPAAGGRVFFKREIVGEETETICKEEGITSSNCWVILHRARLNLRACLEMNWFGKSAVR